jgi:molybdopterin-guanine dinucleotide biosynthesis protein B
MKVVGFAGWSGSGKTTLVEALIPLLKAAGQRVSVIKHAHHKFDVDRVGKDSWRHRQAGAYEVLVASSRRLALMREYEAEAEPEVHALVAELSPAADWVLVEGFRHAALPKVEIWRAELGQPAHYADDPFIGAVATDRPEALPHATAKPVLPLNDPAAVAAWLLHESARHEYACQQ